MIPLRDENPSSTRPGVTMAIIALNAAVFVYELTLGPALREFMLDWGLVPARLSIALHGGESVVLVAPTIFTSLFLHGGWMHLLGNMWYLWIFGDNVEDRLGHARYLAFYLIGGVAASIAHVVTAPYSSAPTIGASGAIATVLGAYAVAFPRARVITLIPLFVFIRIMALPALLVLGLWFVFQLFTGFLSLGFGAQGGVAWWAHIGGFAFGMLAMRLFGGTRPQASHAWVE